MATPASSKPRCECHDTGDGHPTDESIVNATRCLNRATTRLYRVDTGDATGIRFCDQCAEDACSSGLFTGR